MSPDNPKPHSHKGILFLFVLALIAAGAFNFWALHDVKIAILQQAELIEKTTRQDEEALTSSQRAYLLGAETQVQTASADGNEQTRLTPVWQNVGNTPANPAFMEVRCPIIVEKKQEIPKEEMAKPAGQQLQAPDQPISRIKAIFAPKQAMPGGACIFTRDQLILLMPSKPHMFVTARAIYRDVFSGSPLHLTEYCSDTVPVKGPDNKISFQTNLCDRFNCTDDQCPEEDRKEVEKTYGGM